MGEGAALLLVDDDPAVLRLMARILVRAEWDVATAVDAEAARSAAAASAPRVAVVDLGLLPEGGVSLARELQQAHPDIGLVFVSGAPPGTDDRNWIVSVGAQYVGKPFGPDPLLRAVAAAAGGGS